MSRRKRVLEYYVFGSEEQDLIRIVQRGSVNDQAEYDNVAKCKKRTSRESGSQIIKNIVCPGHLCDILEDRDFRS